MECKRCLYDDKILGVTLNEDGICNFCDMHNSLEKQYPMSWGNLAKTFERIKERGKGHHYDCLVGISGGVDSTFMLHLCKVYGARVFAFHFDNGFNTDQAGHNMKVALQYTGFISNTFHLHPNIWRKVNIAVLMAGVSDADIPNDIAMAKLMLDEAHKWDCPTILNGHSFRNEGSVPIGWTYMDGAYLKDMYREYWHDEIPKDFPILSVWDQIKASLRGIKHERILYNLGLTKAEQVKMLKEVIDFKEYSGHHAENDYTSFAGMVTYGRYGIDKRIVVLSAQIRSGRITKREAQITLSEKPYETLTPPLFYRMRDELGLNREVDMKLNKTLEGLHSIWWYIELMPRKMFYEFQTYQKTFRKYRWLVKIAVKMGFLPETFYRKYCQKIEPK